MVTLQSNINVYKGKVAIVTGASRGIGKNIALTLGKAGCIVIGTATTIAGAERISASFEEKDIQGQGFVLDVNAAEDCVNAVKKMTSLYGAPQILVNNAGITRDNLLMRMKEEDWSDVINTNLTSVFRMCKATIRGMLKARWGRIINIGSMVGSSGNEGQANYAAAKMGMEGFARSMAREVGSRNVTVNTIAPGFIETDMTQALMPERIEKILANIPLNRLGKPQDIGDAVLFLVGAEYITGITLNINGGLHMK